MNNLIKASLILLLAFTSQTLFGADETKYSIANVWKSGEYTLYQDCFISLISSSQKEVLMKDQTQVRFSWRADVDELQADGVQKMKLRATRVMLRFDGLGMISVFYDSEKSSLNKDFINDVFNRLKSAEITVLFKNGEVQDVSLNVDVWAGLPEPKDGEEEFFFVRFKSLTTVENLKQIFEPFDWVATPNEVAVNDEWKNQIQYVIPVVGDTTLDWNCKLASVKKSGKTMLARATGTGALNLTLNERVHAEVKAEINADFNGLNGSPHWLEAKTTVSAVKTGEKEEDAETKIVALQKNSMRVANR